MNMDSAVLKQAHKTTDKKIYIVDWKMKITDLQLNIQLSINIRKAHISKTNSYSQYITDAHEACHATMASLAHTHTHTHTHTRQHKFTKRKQGETVRKTMMMALTTSSNLPFGFSTEKAS